MVSNYRKSAGRYGEDEDGDRPPTSTKTTMTNPMRTIPTLPIEAILAEQFPNARGVIGMYEYHSHHEYDDHAEDPLLTQTVGPTALYYGDDMSSLGGTVFGCSGSGSGSGSGEYGGNYPQHPPHQHQHQHHEEEEEEENYAVPGLTNHPLDDAIHTGDWSAVLLAATTGATRRSCSINPPPEDTGGVAQPLDSSHPLSPPRAAPTGVAAPEARGQQEPCPSPHTDDDANADANAADADADADAADGTAASKEEKRQAKKSTKNPSSSSTMKKIDPNRKNKDLIKRRKKKNIRPEGSVTARGASSPPTGLLVRDGNNATTAATQKRLKKKSRPSATTRLESASASPRKRTPRTSTTTSQRRRDSSGDRGRITTDGPPSGQRRHRHHRSHSRTRRTSRPPAKTVEDVGTPGDRPVRKEFPNVPPIRIRDVQEAPQEDILEAGVVEPSLVRSPDQSERQLWRGPPSFAMSLYPELSPTTPPSTPATIASGIPSSFPHQFLVSDEEEATETTTEAAAAAAAAAVGDTSRSLEFAISSKPKARPLPNGKKRGTPRLFQMMMLRGGGVPGSRPNGRGRDTKY